MPLESSNADSLVNLVRRLRTNDSAAWSEFDKRFRPKLEMRARNRLAMRGFRLSVEAMDVVNSVMRGFLEDLHHPENPLDSHGNLEAFLFKKIDWKMGDLLRRHFGPKRDVRRNEGIPVDELDLPAGEKSPSWHAWVRDSLEFIRQNTNETEWKIMHLHREGHSWAEIGDAVGLSPDAARMRHERAIERLRRQVADGEESDT